jgi:uncharacterized sulfatase
MYKSEYSLLFRRLALSFTLFFFYRVLFYLFNLGYFENIHISKILLAFIYGLRFDLATVAIANVVFIILSVIPMRFNWYKKLLKFIFVIFNTVFLTAVVVDIEFFTFLGKKMTFDFFEMGGDIKAQLPQIIKNYWYFSIMVVLNIIILIKLYPKNREEFFMNKKLSLFKTIPIGFLLLVLTSVSIRGGIQLRSLSPKSAFVFEEHELGNLVLNAAYTMTRSVGKKGIDKINFFETDKEAREVILSGQNFETNFESRMNNQNVVIIIVESLSKEYIDKDYAPFIKSLADTSLSFSHAYANGRRSIEVLPSIMASFPSVIGKPIYQSQYQSNKFYALPEVLKENGYSTSFYHGGKKGTMDFDSYCSSIGFDKYYALEDYPNQDHFDGQWGIYDHHYLNYFANNLEKLKSPFFSTIFTLSSHQPYSIPEDYQNRYNKGKLEIHESIGYVDQSLRQFFEKNKDKPWFKNTLFVITADHTQKLEDNTSVLNRYHVPLIFFHPSLNLNEIKPRDIAQHTDIMPSILDFLSIKPTSKLLFGSSVFSNNNGRVFNYTSGSYFYVKDKQLVWFDRENPKSFLLDENYIEAGKVEVDSNTLKELKAYIQYVNNGLKSNNIYE